MATEYKTWQIGGVKVTRVLEQEAPLPPEALIANIDPDRLKAHESWLKPHFMNEEGQIVLSIHALGLSTFRCFAARGLGCWWSRGLELLAAQHAVPVEVRAVKGLLGPKPRVLPGPAAELLAEARLAALLLPHRCGRARQDHAVHRGDGGRGAGRARRAQERDHRGGHRGGAAGRRNAQRRRRMTGGARARVAFVFLD